MTNSRYFQSFARSGMALGLSNPDSPASPPPARASLTVQVTVTTRNNGISTSPPPVTTQVSPYGPGDVIGIDPNQIVRTEPPDGTTNFEPNYLTAVEFDDPELPWLCTPAAPYGATLRPWLCLIALKDGEFSPLPQPDGLPAAITVTSLPALPPLADLWAWAHVEVTGEAVGTDLRAVQQTSPGSVVSRILCPRQLEQDTAYHVFVVPCYEPGRLAGLGLPPAEQAAPAWPQGSGTSLDLPCYFRFGFHTSTQGDFASLVRALKPQPLPATVGWRPLDVSDPGPTPDFAAGTTLLLSGALCSTQPADTASPKPAFGAALAGLINAAVALGADPAGGDDPVVVPPLYGRWHYGHSDPSAPLNPGGPDWFDQLNVDPRARLLAGLGAKVVDDNRGALLASAFEQLAGVARANQQLRQAQLARAAMVPIHRGRLSAAAPELLLSLTRGANDRLLAGTTSVGHTLAQHRLPPLALSAAMARVTARQQTSRAAFLTRLNTVVAAHSAPAGMVSMDQVGHSLPTLASADLARFQSLTTTLFTTASARPSFTLSAGPVTGPATASGVTDSAGATAFRAAAARLAVALQAPSPDPAAPPPLDFTEVRDSVLAGLDPAQTIVTRTLAIVQVSFPAGGGPAAPPATGGWGGSPGRDPLAPIMAYPTFPQAMYEPLRDLSQEYVLPGVGNIPPNAVTLLDADHSVIEAYLVGINHELGRQLLWAGIPGDLRGSYARQFWDVSAVFANPTGLTGDALAESLRDIPPIPSWASPLGDNKLNKAQLILAIRGDVLQRYPETVITAQPAQWNADGTRSIAGVEVSPSFRGTIPPDITFLGFDLDPNDLAGGATGQGHSAGWFFVFKQVPTGTRFGLEPLSTGLPTWADASWADFNFPPLVPGGPVFAQPGIQPKPPQPAPGHATDNANNWNTDSAQTAYILCRWPACLAIPAATMLPTPPGSAS